MKGFGSLGFRSGSEAFTGMVGATGFGVGLFGHYMLTFRGFFTKFVANVIAKWEQIYFAEAPSTNSRK